MVHYTSSLIVDKAISWFIGNISYTVTKQIGTPKTFYSYYNTGNGGESMGFGIVFSENYNISGYVTQDLGIGFSKQVNHIKL